MENRSVVTLSLDWGRDVMTKTKHKGLYWGNGTDRYADWGGGYINLHGY